MENSDSESEEEQPQQKSIDFGDTKLRVTTTKKKRKPKYLSPKHIFIFDDLGQTLRDKSIDSLMKVHRHYLSKCIFSSQYLNDLSPQARLQLDYVLLFKGLPMTKLAEIYKDIDLSVEFEEFLKMYNISTNLKYNFFYIDVRSERFRQNFSNEFIVSKDTDD